LPLRAFLYSPLPSQPLPSTIRRIENLGSPVLMMSPAEFRKLIVEETERWAKVIKFAKIKPE
jgi:hypothetical protein